jgi:hypothetical protein
MATISRHFRKKFDTLFSSNKKVNFEIRFLNEFVYKDILKAGSSIFCTDEIIKKIIARTAQFSISIIGIESRMDDPIPFHDFVIESFEHVHPIEDWPLYALKDYLIKYPEYPLTFFIDIPENQLKTISIVTGLDY